MVLDSALIYFVNFLLTLHLLHVSLACSPNCFLNESLRTFNICQNPRANDYWSEG